MHGIIKVRLEKLGVVIVAMLLLAACPSQYDNAYVEEPVEELYNKALDKLKTGDYSVLSHLGEKSHLLHSDVVRLYSACDRQAVS